MTWSQAGTHLLRWVGALGLFALLWAVFPAAGCNLHDLLTLQRCDGAGLRALILGITAGTIWIIAEWAMWKIRWRKGRM